MVSAKKVFCFIAMMCSFSFLHSMKNKRRFDHLFRQGRPASTPPLGNVGHIKTKQRVRRNNSDLKHYFRGRSPKSPVKKRSPYTFNASIMESGADVTIPSLYNTLTTSSIKKSSQRMHILSEMIDVFKGPNYTQAQKLTFLNAVGQDVYGHKETPLAVAIRKGFVDVAIKLIQEGADFIEKFPYDYGRLTALHAIVISSKMNLLNKERLVAAVLEQLKNRRYGKKGDAFLNAYGEFRSGKMNSVLNIAIQKGFVNIACMLVEAGADITLSNSYGETSLISALGSLHMSCQEKQRLVYRLYTELEKPRYKDVRQLCLHRFEHYANKKFNSFNLPVHCAVFYGDIEKLKQHAQDILKTNGLGQNVLHLVLSSGHYGSQKRRDIMLAIFGILKNFDEDSVKAFVNKQCKDGYDCMYTPLGIAIARKFFSLAKALITIGADVRYCGIPNLLHIVIFSEEMYSYKEKKELVEAILANIEKNMSKDERIAFLNKPMKRKGMVCTALDACLTRGYFDIADLHVKAVADFPVENSSAQLLATKAFLDQDSSLLLSLSKLYVSNNKDLFVKEDDKAFVAALQLIIAFLIEASKKNMDTKPVYRFIKKFLPKKDVYFYCSEHQGRNLLHWVILLKQYDVLEEIIQFGTPDLLLSALCQKSGHPDDRNKTPLEILAGTSGNDLYRLAAVFFVSANKESGKTIFEYAKSKNDGRVFNALLRFCML